MSRKNLFVHPGTNIQITAVFCLAALLVLAACGVQADPAAKTTQAASRASGISVSGPGNAAFASRVQESPAIVHLGSASGASGDATKNPDATFKGCWYKQGKDRYQAVDVSVAHPGEYAFNALLYYGTTCDPNDYADQFGYGQLLDFGGFGYTFWFTAFANKPDMSALWYVGEDESQCMSYADAPAC